MAHLDEMDVPNLSEDELFKYLRYGEGVEAITRNVIKWAVIRREIVPTRIGKSNRFCKRDGLNWLASRKGASNPPGPP